MGETIKNKSDGEQPYSLVSFLLKVKATALIEESLHFSLFCRLHSHIHLDAALVEESVHFSVSCRLHSHIIVCGSFVSFRQNSTTLAKFRLCLNDVCLKHSPQRKSCGVRWVSVNSDELHFVSNLRFLN